MEENKYIIHNDLTDEAEVRRQMRRKRRVRNRVISIFVLLIFVLLLVVGAVFLVIKIPKAPAEQPKQQQDELESVLNELIGDEGKVQVVTPSEADTPPTNEKLLDQMIDDMIASMTLEDKVAGLFIVSPEQLTGVDTVTKAGDGTKDALTKYAVGGIIYDKKNIVSEEQFKEVISNTKSYARYIPFIMMEEESGRSQFSDSKLPVEATDNAKTIGASMDPYQAYQAGQKIGTYLKQYGVSVNAAPVADVLTDPMNTTIGDRSFGSDSTIVGQMISQMVTAMEEQGVSACLKFFPGLGDTDVETSTGMAMTERSLDDMRACEFHVFQAGIDAGADFVIVGHVSAPNVTGDNTPCSLSKFIMTDTLRIEMNFDGVIIADAMNKAAISEYYDSAEAAVKALKAGADMVMLPENMDEALTGVTEAVKTNVISEERINQSLKRIYRIKYADRIGQE